MNITIPSSNIAQKRVFTDLSHNFIAAQCSTCHGCLHGLRCLSNPCFSYLCACALVENRMNKHTKCMYMYIYIYILYIIYYIIYIYIIVCVCVVYLSSDQSVFLTAPSVSVPFVFVLSCLCRVVYAVVYEL